MKSSQWFYHRICIIYLDIQLKTCFSFSVVVWATSAIIMGPTFQIVLTQPEITWFIFRLRDKNINFSGNTCYYASLIFLKCLREHARDHHASLKGRHQFQWQEQARYVGEFSLFGFLKRPNNLISIVVDSWLNVLH